MNNIDKLHIKRKQGMIEEMEKREERKNRWIAHILRHSQGVEDIQQVITEAAAMFEKENA